jgi:hypothetical protein
VTGQFHANVLISLSGESQIRIADEDGWTSDMVLTRKMFVSARNRTPPLFENMDFREFRKLRVD